MVATSAPPSLALRERVLRLTPRYALRGHGPEPLLRPNRVWPATEALARLSVVEPARPLPPRTLAWTGRLGWRPLSALVARLTVAAGLAIGTWWWVEGAALPTSDSQSVVGWRTGTFSHTAAPPEAAAAPPLKLTRGSRGIGLPVVAQEIRPGTPSVLRWTPQILEAARRYEVPPSLLAAIMDVESRGYATASSGAGALGLMQVMPFHFSADENPWDPATNIAAGARVLRAKYVVQGENWNRAVRAYFGFKSYDPWSGVDDYVYLHLVLARAPAYAHLDGQG